MRFCHFLVAVNWRDRDPLLGVSLDLFFDASFESYILMLGGMIGLYVSDSTLLSLRVPVLQKGELYHINYSVTKLGRAHSAR